MAPLHEAVRSTTTFLWGESQQQAYEAMKEAVTTAPVLAWPNFELPFSVTPDASNIAIGGVLEQDQGKGNQPIAYCSRKLIDAEIKYPTHEKELLSILFCCKKWRHYLIARTNS